MSDSNRDSAGTLGRIALKQVRVARSGAQTQAEPSANATAVARNRLVPYLDLFARLGDDELSRLASVPTAIVAAMRTQVEEICGALGSYRDLLPRLGDQELARLTGATEKTVRFWRLCMGNPAQSQSQDSGGSGKHPAAKSGSAGPEQAQAGSKSGPARRAAPDPFFDRSPQPGTPAPFEERSVDSDELRLNVFEDDRPGLDHTMAISMSSTSELGDDEDISFDLVDEEDL